MRKLFVVLAVFIGITFAAYPDIPDKCGSDCARVEQFDFSSYSFKDITFYNATLTTRFDPVNRMCKITRVQCKRERSTVMMVDHEIDGAFARGYARTEDIFFEAECINGQWIDKGTRRRFTHAGCQKLIERY